MSSESPTTRISKSAKLPSWLVPKPNASAPLIRKARIGDKPDAAVWTARSMTRSSVMLPSESSKVYVAASRISPSPAWSNSVFKSLTSVSTLKLSLLAGRAGLLMLAAWYKVSPWTVSSLPSSRSMAIEKLTLLPNCPSLGAGLSAVMPTSTSTPAPPFNSDNSVLPSSDMPASRSPRYSPRRKFNPASTLNAASPNAATSSVPKGPKSIPSSTRFNSTDFS